MWKRSFVAVFWVILFVLVGRYFSQGQGPVKSQRQPASEVLVVVPKPIKKQEIKKIEKPVVVEPEKMLTDKPARPHDEVSACYEELTRQAAGEDFYNANKEYFHQFVGDWFFSKNDVNLPDNERSVQGKFLLAMARAGSLKGGVNDQNFDESLRLLAEVNQMDPENSAPLLFAAAIENDRGHTQQAEELYQKSLQTKKFNSYVSDMYKVVISRMKTTADLINGSALVSGLPFPDLKDIKNFMKKRDSKKIAMQIVAPALIEKNMAQLDWTLQDYAYGKSMMNAADPQNTLPTTKEMMNRIELNPMASKARALIKKNCDLSSLEPVLDIYKKRDILVLPGY